MPFTTLVDAETLARNLSDPQWALFDCRFRLDSVQWGEDEYLKGHIPGAVYAHLDRDLSGRKTGLNGRHPLPEPSKLADTFGRLGIGADTQVVAYDQDSGAYASRLWWLLRWLGHEAVAVLDGGFAGWIADRRPISAERESRPERQFTAHLRAGLVVSANDVLEIVRRGHARLVDARDPERYRGDVEPIDTIAGHIPTAKNHSFKGNLGSDGRFRSREALRALWTETLGGIQPDEVVNYCGSGVTACHNLLALEHAGLPGARLYPGSWSEWVSDPSRPTERG